MKRGIKSKVTFFPAIAGMLLLGSCTTGSYVTDRYDDIYFSPGDVPPPVVAERAEQETNETDTPLVISESEGRENHIFTTDRPNADAHVYSMDDMELVGSDTTYLDNEGGGSTIINNYYEGDDLDFAYRINRFHRYPFYDPFYWDSWYYDPFYSPYYSWGYYDWYWPGSSLWFGVGMGWGLGWYSPWYSPYYSWGYYDWGYPYHGHYYGGGYYYNDENHSYGHRRSSYSTIDRGDYGSRSSSSFRRGSTSSYRSNSVDTRQDGVIPVTGTSRRANSVSGATSSSVSRSTSAGTVMEKRRATPAGSAVSVSGRRSISGTGNTQIINDPSSRSTQRRNVSSSYSRQASPTVRPSNGTSYQRSSVSGRDYTPSYSKPRTVTRSTYNNSSSSGTRSTYSTPSNSQSNSRSSYRSGTSYSKGSSSGSRPTYSAPTRSSSSYRSNSSYTPSRSTYSSPASSGGSRSSGGSSGRSGSSGSGRR